MNTETINFSDIFKNSFTEKLEAFSLLDIGLALGFAFAIGLFIMFIYKKTFKGVMYSQSFAVSLMAMSLITTLIILAVTSNVVLSLGMVGALSIVRFRSAVKEPIDIAFLFWSISVGIVLGAGLLPLAIFGSIFIGVIMVLFVNKSTKDISYILILNCQDHKSEQDAIEKVKEQVAKNIVKSKTITQTGIELTLEVRLKNMATDFINDLCQIKGVTNAVLVSYNGDYMG